MGLFGQLLNATTSGGFPPRDPVIAEYLGLGGSTEAGINVTPDTAMQSTAVLSAVRLLSETIAILPLILYRRIDGEGKEKDKQNPLWELLRYRPNAKQTPFEYWKMVVAHVLLRGNSFSFIVSNGRGKITDLIPLHPDRVRPFLAPDGKIAYAYQPLMGEIRVFLQDEIFRLGSLSEDGTKSKSLIQQSAEAIGIALAGDAFAARFYANDGTPGGIITGATWKDPVDKIDGDLARFVKSWKALTGGKRHGGTPILENGMEYKEIGVKNKDAQYMESRKFQITEIARIFRVPPHMLMDLSKATFSNIGEQGQEFVRYTLSPWYVQIEQAIRLQLFTSLMRKNEQFVAFLVAALLRADLKARYESYNIGRNAGFLNVDEIRAMENMNPLPNGAGQTYLVPLNMAPAGESSDEDDEDTQDINNKLLSNAARHLATKESNFVSKARNTHEGKKLKDKVDAWFGDYKKLLSAMLVVDEDKIPDEMIEKFVNSAYNQCVNIDLRVDELLNFVQNLNKTGVKDES
jgi:HK97 family phage portal protein